ncbi:hypothetical protein ANANG_G00279720 [Anguilla anguilla]|uniref:Zinc finger protein 142 n=1 Tax=Anguilla anguilla TaxID=7936 RepID=A0A9D3RKG3_ANGAN|nr:hypothetical protein ANANG_G00279720 [Anguilla anguilla]
MITINEQSSGAAMDTNSAETVDHSTATEVLLEKIVNGDTIELTDVSLETEGLYHCEKCRQNFPDSNLFSSHPCLVSASTSCTPRLSPPEEATVKTRSDLYKCPRCDETFPLPSTLKRHFRSHPVEPPGPVHCSEPGCQFVGADRREYQTHLRVAHSLTPVPCAVRSCRLAFRTGEEMEKHRRNHVPFHCPQCQFTTANAKQLGEHRRTSHPPGAGDEGEKADDSEKMEVRSRGAELHGNGPCAPGRRKRPQTNAPPTADEPQEEEEEEEEGHINKKAREEKEREGTAAATGPEDHHSTCHVAEGTEHMFRTHICPECRRCFKKRTHLLEHMHLHFPDPRLQCPACRRHFTSKSKLRVHLLREEGQKPHRCHLCEYRAVERNALRRHLAGEGCGFQAADRRELRRHAADAHGAGVVECRHHACRALFGSPEAMEAHHRTHLAFHCEQCDFSCSNKSRFQRHKRQGHAGDRRLVCAFCPFATFNPVEFDGHVGRLHANEKIHRCPQCSFVTAHKRVLGRHMLLHTGEKPHKCKLCNFRCRDETYLSKHMLTHSDAKNHMCSECGYVTKWKHYLNVHMRKHAGDLRYQCDQCSYRCHRADQLSSHKLRHQEKSLICEVCAFSCKRKYELRKHMQLKHAQGGGVESQPPVFQCKYCAYRTQYRQALHNHENCKHTRLREFRCALCAYSTFSSTSLFLHKRKAHGYVPGDTAWLERYAQRERENSAAAAASHSFCPQGPAPQPGEAGARPGGARREPGGGSLGREGPRFGGRRCRYRYRRGPRGKRPGQTGRSCRRRPRVDSCRNSGEWRTGGGAGGGGVLHFGFDPDAERGVRGCAPCAECRWGRGDAASEGAPGDPESLPARRAEPAAPSPRASDAEEDDASVADCGGAERRGGEQAEALVLEGRVQMLVVQTKGSVYRCERCSYVTRRQASLAQHRRSACPASRAALRCQDCGAQFKQRRGLDTHRLRKCPVLLKKSRRFPRPAAGGPGEGPLRPARAA